MRKLVVFLASAVLVLAACGGDDDAVDATSSTASTVDGGGSDSTTPLETADGGVAALITAVDLDANTLTYDEIEFLTGDAATTRYRADHPEDPTGFPDNEYVTVNDQATLATGSLADTVDVTLVKLSEDSDPDLDAASLEELPGYDMLTAAPFWLTFTDGKITAIEEQYVP